MLRKRNSNKVVLITGGSGMVGRNLKYSLKMNNVKYLSPSSNVLNLSHIKSIETFFKKNKFDYIVHCAGLVGGIEKNIRNQLAFYQENLEIGYNLVNTANKFKIKNLINLGSSCMYPSTFKRGFREKDLMSGPIEETNYGYALAKINIALFIKLIREKNNMNYSTIIPPNLYGYHDNFDPDSSHLIQSIITKCLICKKKRKKNITIWGTGKAKREFLFTSDLTDFISKVIKNDLKLPILLNVGYGRDFYIKEYYDFVQQCLGTRFNYKFDKKKPDGVFRKLIDSNIAKTEFNWIPKTDIKMGISKIIDFYKKNYEI
tara:strand:+ start:1877 stop:2824 length:948 start_codon:yes stop_codon:yes gene_type:complete